MKTFGILVLAAAVGYAGGFAIGMGLVNLWSSNRHDKSMEAAMTAAFLFGPIGAVIGLIVTWLVWLR